MKPTSLTSRMLASQPMGRTKEDGRKPYFMRNELLWLVLHRIIEAICGGSIKMGSLLCSMARPLMQPPVKNSSMGPMGCAAMTTSPACKSSLYLHTASPAFLGPVTWSTSTRHSAFLELAISTMVLLMNS
mmetsp:Transcript_23/g.62  ORF Transcript_23/g.62 Transcript_23/m.62 type:complete len:130 (-) Transcript_23:507-896(-)